MNALFPMSELLMLAVFAAGIIVALFGRDRTPARLADANEFEGRSLRAKHEPARRFDADVPSSAFC